MKRSLFAVALLALIALGYSSQAQNKGKPAIPHNQKNPPNDPLSPADAIKKMQVPEGFSVEVVASEPDLVNPVAFTFDEKGRIWVVESLEYPRFEPGPGRDRIKILEDTDNDGRIDKVSIFAEGLNIPSGIAVGHGGVWVANSPDILLLKDTNGDGKADSREVVITGFGRHDTHELPNSLTWGPDGWLYGYNGIFNYSKINHQGKEQNLTCALFRIHPRTRQFEIFAEGTSNPWGLAFDTNGSAFASACVIDHLWHLVETGYYHRQAGVYPPFTWKIMSIVKHKHQMAAYCGLHYFDSDAYPPEYREMLYMGNIHGNCINADKLERNGATYFAKPRHDLLTANDAWFMPVGQKTGPDGCLYILDWYDRYHCYQDARRDPAGIDRLRGRIYRVRYKNTPRAGQFDLASETDESLLNKLGHANVYYRDLAQRLLNERLVNSQSPGLRPKVEQIVLDEKAGFKARMHALFTLVSSGPLPEEFHLRLLGHKEEQFRAWGVRAAGNTREVSQEIRARIRQLAKDDSPDVCLQVAIAARKITALDATKVLSDVVAHSETDPILPQIVWQNLHPLMNSQEAAQAFIKAAEANPSSPTEAALLGKLAERLLADKGNHSVIASLLALLVKDNHQEAGKQVCLVLAGKTQSGEIPSDQIDALRQQLAPVLSRVHSWNEVKFLLATWNDPPSLQEALTLFNQSKSEESLRLQAFDAVTFADPARATEMALALLKGGKESLPLRAGILGSMGKLTSPALAAAVLDLYPSLEPTLQPRAVELLTQRPGWASTLLDAVANKKLPASAISITQARKLNSGNDAKLKEKLAKHWGTVREGRDLAREKILQEIRAVVLNSKGDPGNGKLVYNKVCGQCHKMHGEGQEVGPDITANGRASFDQLLSNVFDPGLVIGADYQATQVVTTKGRLLSGLLVENSPARVALKVQGGKLEIVPRAEIEEMKRSPNSLMPEGVEKQITPKELADLVSYLIWDKPPGSPGAKKIPGAP
ncbi:MAG: c-type cytochrome [Gemmataceae bacterium]|nr:c-type cytochrome [Gemmataceae bacterium]